jgi:hypothetical protein
MQRTADELSSNSARILYVSRVPLRGLHPIDSVSWQTEKAYFLVRDGAE